MASLHCRGHAAGNSPCTTACNPYSDQHCDQPCLFWLQAYEKATGKSSSQNKEAFRAALVRCDATHSIAGRQYTTVHTRGLTGRSQHSRSSHSCRTPGIQWQQTQQPYGHVPSPVSNLQVNCWQGIHHNPAAQQLGQISHASQLTAAPDAVPASLITSARQQQCSPPAWTIRNHHVCLCWPTALQPYLNPRAALLMAVLLVSLLLLLTYQNCNTDKHPGAQAVLHPLLQDLWLSGRLLRLRAPRLRHQAEPHTGSCRSNQLSVLCSCGSTAALQAR